MNKKMVETIAFSLLVLSLSIGFLIFMQKAFPSDFDRITGHVTTRVNVSQPINASCNATFYPGENLVSFFCITTTEDMYEFSSLLPEFSRIFTYRSSDSSDPWKAFNPSLPSWVVHDLEYFSRRDAYWIYFTDIINSTIFTYVNGSKRIPTNIDIYQGWNLVGYPTDTARDIDIAFASINESYEMALWFNNTNKTYYNYTNGVGGNFNVTMPYQGYWIIANTSDVWVIDW